MIRKIAEDYTPENITQTESILQTYTYGLIKDIQRQADSRYRKYLQSKSEFDLGYCEGLDKAVEILKKMFDE